MNMLEIISEEIKQTYSRPRRRLADYEYNVFCSPRVFEEVIEAIKKDYPIPVFTQEGEVVPKKELKLKTVHLGTVGTMHFHPVLTKGFRVEEIK